jgi:hypothetical protein
LYQAADYADGKERQEERAPQSFFLTVAAVEPSLGAMDAFQKIHLAADPIPQARSVSQLLDLQLQRLGQSKRCQC